MFGVDYFLDSLGNGVELDDIVLRLQVELSNMGIMTVLSEVERGGD